MAYVFRLAILSHVFIFSFIFISCASSVRYTTKENSENKFESKRTYSNLEETYKDYKVLGSDIEIASYYSDDFHGKKTANGEIYNMYDYTAAHISYPFNTINSSNSSFNGLDDSFIKSNSACIGRYS